MIVDARGMSCPQPVLMTKKAVGTQAAAFEILVDSQVAKNNVERFLKSSGYTPESTEDGGDIRIHAKK